MAAPIASIRNIGYSPTMATLIYSHPASLAHETPAGHPERIDRIRTVHQVIRSPHFKATIHREAPLGTEEQILRAHTEEHYQRILAAAPEHGFEYLDADTPMSPGSLAAALRAVGGACAAVDAVLANDADNAFIASTASAAAQAPPTARKAAAKEPGLMGVSASRYSNPCSGAAARMR